ncbi:NAD(P)H-dependent flavin oxidoreductase [Ruania zhangjianzhongii]|uniref:NAD(P)H-dependent flavin oxidoreductase n=1 Tax=Ruania zhangjianzhongii TaxID=2603206 RepID=UPI0011C7DCDC|nr:nitronate monooxygenase [Ruania zhangjianzhongii]
MTRQRLTDLLGVQVPIALGAFGGVSSVELTAQVSRLGGLGSYGLYGYDAARISETIGALRAATTEPFAVNLWVPTGDEVRPEDVDLDPALAAAEPLFDTVGVPRPQLPAAFLPDFGAQIAAVIEARPPVVSFVFGLPEPAVMNRLQKAGIRVLGTATTVEEAVHVARGGADAIIATGLEAGGHRVSFLRPAEESLVGTFALVPQVVDAVDVPVLAAGGIADRRGVAAARALGAEGVLVGTAFLRTRQSAASNAHRQAIADAGAAGTVLTRAMSGRLSRGVRNRAVEVLESGGQVAPFPAQNWLTGQFRAVANREGIGELQSLWVGQGAGLARYADAAEVFAELRAGL